MTNDNLEFLEIEDPNMIYLGRDRHVEYKGRKWNFEYALLDNKPSQCPHCEATEEETKIYRHGKRKSHITLLPNQKSPLN